MSRNAYQFEDFQLQQQQEALNVQLTELDDIPDYLTCDLKLSDTTFKDLFSEYDVNTNDFQGTTDLSSSNNIILHPMATISETQSLEPIFDEALSPAAFELLIEQYQKQQANTNLSSFPPNYIPTDHQESLSTNMFNCQLDQTTLTSEQITATNCSQSLPVQLSKLIHKHEPISVTFDQFKALICATSDTLKTNTNVISTLLENSTIIGHNIPLRIVHQTSQIHSPNSSDELNHHQDSLTNNDHYQSRITNGNGGRTQRKSSHNVIEKRYRCSINQKINELKDIVAGSDGKIQKSGILRRTVEYIRQLQSTNQRLEEENTTLKIILKQVNLTNVDFSSNNDVRSSGKSSSGKNPTPVSSTFSADSHNHVSKRRKRTKSKRGMVNGSRLALCCFMLCVLITNPFNYLLDRIHSSDNGDTTELQSIVSSRTLQATTENEKNFNSLIFFSISWKQLIAWMLNIAICLVCLVKLLVHGEPIIHESEMDEYYAYKKKADQFMEENQLNEARIYYQKCCEQLYISIDNTNLYYLCSITWQIIRLCLNLLFVGRWLIYWSGWTKSIDTRNYNLELNDCLLQLWKIEYHYSTSLLNLFNLFLSTINTSINSGKKFDRTKRNEIYFLSALTFKKFNGLFSIVIPYLLKYLKPIDTNDIWLLDHHRLNQFIFDKNIYLFKEKIFLESIRIQYLEYILYDNILNQLLFHDEQQQIGIQNELDRFSWWQYSLQVIRCISNDKQNITSIDLVRQIKSSEQTIYHMARSQQLVDERYIMIIETIHNILIVLMEDDDQTNSTRIRLLEQLGVLSQLFTSMIETCCHINNENNLDMPLVHCCCIAFTNLIYAMERTVQQEGGEYCRINIFAIKTLLLDGILSLRLRLLTSSMTNNNQKIPYLDDFQRELDHYKQLNQLMKLPKHRLYLFESIFRTSSGLNPLITQTLFERAINKQSNSILQIKEESSPNLDIMAALLLFCHFSPSTVHRYRNILQQAVTTSLETNKNNDLNRLQRQCSVLIRQSYLTL